MPKAVLSAYRANSDEAFAEIARLYLAKGIRIADVTYGGGRWWRKIKVTDYRLVKQDALTGHNAANTTLKGNSLDAFLFDPPFLRSSRSSYTKLPRFRVNYNLSSASTLKTHEDLLRLYDRVAKEASRVLRKQGHFIIKVQDEVANGRQRLTHVELINRFGVHGFKILDLFVLMRKAPPLIPAKNQRQLFARKNHSYFLVFQKVTRRRLPAPMEWD